MRTPRATELSVAQQLAKVPPATRPIVRAARRTVRSIAPKAVELGYRSSPPRSTSAMWKIVRYVMNDAPVVAIGTFSTHASLFFFRGSELADASGLLEGGGKQLRYIRLRRPADAERPAVRRIVRQAFTLARS